MTIHHLNIFYHVCKDGSMTGAAKSLFMTQPSVSQSISELEKHYDTKLFKRLNNRLFLTEHGKILLDLCEDMLPVFFRSEETMLQLSKTPIVSVGASATVGAYVLPILMRKFHEQVPNVQVYSLVNNTAHIVGELLKGNLSIGFVEGAVTNDSITQIPFMKDKIVVVCSETHEFADRGHITLKDLEDIPVVLRETGSGTRVQFEEAMRENNYNMNVVGEHFSTDSIINYITYNHVIGVVSIKFLNVQPENAPLKVFEIDERHFNRIFSIIYHKNALITPELETLISLAKSLKLPS